MSDAALLVPLPASYPCVSCAGTGLRPRPPWATALPDEPTPCEECDATGRVGRVRVAKAIVRAAIALKEFGRVVGRSPYLVAAAHAGDRGLLEPWRRAGQIVLTRRAGAR